MRLVIVPNEVRDAINAKLDVVIASLPDAAKDRDVIYNQLLDYFDKHGCVPDFKIEKAKEFCADEKVVDSENDF